MSEKENKDVAHQENNKEREARQALEAQLDPGEELIAYTRGNITGVLRGVPHYIGLTRECLFLLPIRKRASSNRTFGFRRESVTSLILSGLIGTLHIRFPKDKLDFAIRGRLWKKRAKAMVELSAQAASPSAVDIPLTGSRHLQQARDFQGLGLIASAQHELSAALQNDPALSMDPSVAPLQEQLTQGRLALRTGAAFLAGNVGLAIVIGALLSILGGVTAVADYWGTGVAGALVIDVAIGISLWQGQAKWRTVTIFRATLGFLFFGIGALIGADLTTFISLGAFSGSLLLVLTGESSRSRTLAATAIYGIGFLGISIFSILVPLIQNRSVMEHYEQGVDYYELGQYDLAIESFSLAISLDPEFTEAYTFRGHAQLDSLNTGQAILDYDQAIALDPEYAEAYYFRGLAYYYTGDFDQAVSDFEKALELGVPPSVQESTEEFIEGLR